ncbi:MAG: S1 RNA-binding domain-containing protein, partial [Thermoguttaceae bacterium]|nr:S1 RNA-binding domain-containing protein [Thermoguttaceae bacterium]
FFYSVPMENSDQNVVPENDAAPVETTQQPTEETQTPVSVETTRQPAAPVETAPQPTGETQAPAPLPTYESMNGDAPVVTGDVIEERLKKAAPLGAVQEANRRKRENAKPGADENAEAKERRPREKRERPERGERKISAPKRPVTSAVLPNRREGLGELEDEFAALCEGQELDSLIASSVEANVGGEMIEDGTKVECRVETIAKDSVFVNVGSTELGLIPLKQFPEDMVLSVGQKFEGIVNKFNSEDGYYEVSLPLAAAEVGDWMSLSKGAVVEARVTGVNKGGLEVEVGRLRGFLPAGQVQIVSFDLANAEQFVGEVWKCVVTEVNPERRNLVVSRRKLIEMERAELREKTIAELEVGQTREGTVRKLIDVGAFVDLGGVDGFIHISQMGWGRVNKPEDVVKVGDKVKVTILKIDLERNRISLSLRDSAADPWVTVESEYKVGDVVCGKVTKLMEFGAFVELPNGLEGLVHISEIAYQRVNKVSDALTVGDVLDVKILYVDAGKKKISLSIKKTQEDPRVKEREEAQAKADAEAAQAENEAKRKEEAALAEVREKIEKLQSKKPLKGGLGRQDDSDKFGLHF